MQHGIFMAKIAQGNGEINFDKLDFMGIKDRYPLTSMDVKTGSLINNLPYYEAVMR